MLSLSYLNHLVSAFSELALTSSNGQPGTCLAALFGPNSSSIRPFARAKQLMLSRRRRCCCCYCCCYCYCCCCCCCCCYRCLLQREGEVFKIIDRDQSYIQMCFVSFSAMARNLDFPDHFSRSFALVRVLRWARPHRPNLSGANKSSKCTNQAQQVMFVRSQRAPSIERRRMPAHTCECDCDCDCDCDCGCECFY